ncbi:MAG: hypothetical protein KC476_08120 [Cyanobacteria bacterium HKST-UBA06]|nr:hypothetical protein [Cyanobacteria bacterium HKST-UBA06]
MSKPFLFSWLPVLLLGTALASVGVVGCGVVKTAVTHTPNNLTIYRTTFPYKIEEIPLLKGFDEADACLKEVKIHDKPGPICGEGLQGGGYVVQGSRIRTIDCQAKLMACQVQVMEEANRGWKGYLPFEWIEVVPDDGKSVSPPSGDDQQDEKPRRKKHVVRNKKADTPPAEEAKGEG